ncbi:hypothetical protein JCM8547_002233 [Rhodosporidiobolus lusitaniae]
MAPDVSAHLQALLAPPSPSTSRTHAKDSLAASLPSPLAADKLGPVLAQLLEQQHAESARLKGELARSKEESDRLVTAAKVQTSEIQRRTNALKSDNASVQKGLREARDKLVSGLENKEDGDEGLTLRERLVLFSQRRKELEAASKWFGAVAKAEELAFTVLRSIDAGSLPQAFRAYVGLIDYIKLVYRDTAAAKTGGEGVGIVALTSHLVGMANSVWNSLVKVLSSRLLAKLEALGWPQPFAEPLDPYEDNRVAEFQTAFVDLLTLELLQANNPIPTPSASASTATSKKPKPLLALIPLVHPLLLRFKWQFDGDRTTNRIDKPEYPLSHVLNLLTAHERFLSEDIQYLLDSNGFEHIDAVNEFTTLLLPPLSSRLRHHLPQLISMPPVLAHTVYQVVEFDQQLRARGYRPRTEATVLREGEEAQAEEEGEWNGLCETILGRQEWFERWLEGEREFFDKRYFDAIGAPDAWHIVPEEDYDAGEGGSGTRPTNSALRVKELAEQLTDRYRPIPLRHTLPFLLTIHLPLLQSYATRITSSLDAFESLSFGILPGALGQTTAATAGVGGVIRLVRAGVSARWMSERCEEWGEDAFFLTLYDYLNSANSTPGKLDRALQDAAEDVLDNSEGTIFDRERKYLETQADRSEDLIVRHCAREVVNELKPYFAKRWDLADEEMQDLSLSAELIAPLSLLSSLLSTLVQSFPISTSVSLYRRIASSLSQTLFDRLLVPNGWTLAGAHQFQYDLENGFFVAGREAGIPRNRLARGWDVAKGGATVLALPAQASQQGAYLPGGEWTFSRVMQVAFDDAEGEGEGTKFGEMMDDLSVGEALNKDEVKQLLRRRPECWR